MNYILKNNPQNIRLLAKIFYMCGMAVEGSKYAWPIDKRDKYEDGVSLEDRVNRVGELVEYVLGTQFGYYNQDIINEIIKLGIEKNDK